MEDQVRALMLEEMEFVSGGRDGGGNGGVGGGAGCGGSQCGSGSGGHGGGGSSSQSKNGTTSAPGKTDFGGGGSSSSWNVCGNLGFSYGWKGWGFGVDGGVNGCYNSGNPPGNNH